MKIDRGTAVAALLAGSIAAAASLGVPHEGMLQDTFKSAVVAIGALAAAIVFVRPRTGDITVRWHPVLLLPVLLCAYALGSMAWAQTWQAGVEAVRWGVIALIAALAMQVFDSQRRRRVLACGLAFGATVASLWVVLQFFFAFDVFPQGARPASTFVNRNFFAEFAVCTLPFFAFLLDRERRTMRGVMVAVSMGIVVSAIGMTGARAALVAVIGLLVFVPARKTLDSGLRRKDTGLRRNDTSLSSRRRPGSSVFWLCALATFIVLAIIPTGDPRVAAEHRGDTALARAFVRAGSIASRDEATTMRMDLWSATTSMIASHPLAGIGAGAWDNEADRYAHNEFLQLVAEYGVVGWVFLIALCAWLLQRAHHRGTWAMGAWDAALLGGLLALAIVSIAGYPMHLAATSALFAVCVGSLAVARGRSIRLRRGASIALAVACALGVALAAYATWTAARAEGSLARAARIALDIGGTSDPNDVRWAPARSEMLRLVDQGMRLHPNERQLTPIVADELGRWGDWPNAIRIWEHVLRSHPDTVVILTNVARGYIAIGRREIAAAYLDRARRIDPRAPSVRAVETLLRQTSASKG